MPKTLLAEALEALEACCLRLENHDEQSVPETMQARSVLDKVTLIEKIQSSNNGYLFAPSECEITLAKKFPDVFNYINVQSGLFPHRISLK